MAKKPGKKVISLMLAGILALSGMLPLWSENGTSGNINDVEIVPIEDIVALSPTPPDTLSTVADTLLIAKTYIDSLFYQADSIFYDYDSEQIYLFGDTSVRYQSSTILADSLQIDLKNERAFSIGKTVMMDKDQVLIGDQVLYDTKSQTGMMYNAASKMDKGFYYGEEVRKVDDDVYDVDGGRFTTCNDPEPDFWFWAKEMRLYRNDKIVGKPVIAYVNHMPIFYFPFITFSIKRGRQAGFLIPEPGYNTVDGKFIKNIAFFYPYKDYADATLGFDLMEKTGWNANLETRYTKRYLYNGNFDTSIRRQISQTSTNTDYSVRGTHHHELGNKATFDANIDYVSNKRIWESSTDIDQSLAQSITSSLSFRKPLLSSYLNVGATYTEDLINNTANISLPSATFSLPSRPVYELFTKKDDTSVSNNWWTNFNYSYNVRLDHTGNLRDKQRSLQDLVWNNTYDSTGTHLINEHHLGMKHSAGLNYSYKALGWLNLTQGFNYNEVWADRDKNDDKWVRGNDYSTTSSANFTIYGIRNLPNFYVSTVRHIITPSVSFNYSPDFTDNSRFYYFGGTGLMASKQSRTVNLALDQKWQLKLRPQGNLQERKLNDILSWTTATGINLEKDERKFGNIAHNISFKPGAYNLGKTKITWGSSYNLTHNPYQMHWLNWKPISQYFSHTLSITGNAKYRDYFPRKVNQDFASYLSADDSLNTIIQSQTGAPKDEAWSFSLTQDMSTGRNLLHPENNSFRMNADFKLTTNWSLGYSNYYNVKDSRMISQSFDINRTLHCWKLSIQYTRRTDYWDYRIVFFNASLPDALKFQTKDNKRY